VSTGSSLPSFGQKLVTLPEFGLAKGVLEAKNREERPQGVLTLNVTKKKKEKKERSSRCVFSKR